MSHCEHCVELEARLHRAEQLISQLSTQTAIAMLNQAEARAAIDEFWRFSPDGAALLAS